MLRAAIGVMKAAKRRSSPFDGDMEGRST
jgi:hypothetical protein